MKTSPKRLKITAAVLVFLGFLALAFRGSTAPIEFGNEASGDLAAKSILADRDKTIKQLEDVIKQNVNNPAKKEAVTTAMRLLGNLRADHAAPLLAANLTFTDPGKNKMSQRIPTIEDYYPAVDALVHIGMFSVDVILFDVASTDDRKQDDLRNYVLIKVLGQPAAITFLEDTVNNEHDDVRKRRLNALLTGLRKAPYVPRYTVGIGIDNAVR